MPNPIHNAILSGALAGMMAGALAGCGSSEAPAPEKPAEASKASTDQTTEYKGNSCAGSNVCKGLGGCKVEGKHDCKGLNDCKGQGGCHITGEEQAKFAAKMAEKSAH